MSPTVLRSHCLFVSLSYSRVVYVTLSYCWTPHWGDRKRLPIHAHTVNITLFMPLFPNQWGGCFQKHVFCDEHHRCSCRLTAGVCVCISACLYLHVLDRLCSWKWDMVTWVALSQHSANGCYYLPCWGIFKTLLSALCSVSSATQHHWGSPQLPVVLTGTLAASCHISQLENLLLTLQPIGLALHFLARWDSKCAAAC